MQRKLFLLFFVLSIVLVGTVNAAPRKVLFSELSKNEFTKILKGNPTNLIIEFTQGDHIPVTITASGDLFEFSDIESQNLAVKRTFFLNFTEMPNLLMSWNGEKFVPFRELVSGSYEIGFSGQPANQVFVNLEVLEKR